VIKVAEYARTSIIDIGCGISEELQPLIFHKFVRGDTEGNKKTRGAGLGLGITKQIIFQHQGTNNFLTINKLMHRIFKCIPLINFKFS
jgi:signal transduction histidine kinase